MVLKRLFVSLLLFIIGFSLGYGQVRHIKGLKGLEVTAGATGQAPFVSAGFSQYLHRQAYWKGSIGYEKGTVSDADFSTLFIDATMNYTFISVVPSFFINGVAGLSWLNENIEEQENTSDQSGSSVGLLIGLEAEVYLDHRWAMVINANQRSYFQSDFGKNRWTAGIGVKRIF